MEQSVLSVEQQRWVTAISTLTNLTYQKKVTWQKQRPLQVDEISAAFMKTEPPTRYTLSGQDGISFALVVTHRPNYLGALAYSYSGLETPPDTLTFEARKGDKKIFSMSDFSVLRVLADAIDSQVEEYEEEAFRAIEKLGK